MNQKGLAPLLLILIIAAAIAAVGGLLYYEQISKNLGSGPVACTMEAKLCPDGSAVGRTGPKCEFAECPTSTPSASTTVDIASWQIYRNEQYGFEVKYPGNFKSLNTPDNLLDVGLVGEQGFEYYFTLATEDAGSVCITADTYSLQKVKADQNLQRQEVKSQSDVSAWEVWSKVPPPGAGGMVVYVSRKQCEEQKVGQVFSARFGSGPLYGFDPKIADQILSTFKFITPVGKFCGGIAPGAFPCPEGYVCKLDGAFPDAGGHCVLPDGTGTLSGKVTIGPNCPVERIDQPCPTPPEAYAAREFSVTQNGKLIATFHADATGGYIISLKPGTYQVISVKSGIGYMSKDLPATVTIKAGAASNLNIDIDTGIR